MTAARFFVFLILSFVGFSVFAVKPLLTIGPPRIDSLKPGLYVLKSENGSPLWELAITRASEDAKMYTVKGTIFGPIEAMNMEVVGVFYPATNRLKAETLEIPNVGLKVLNIDGKWDPVKNVLMVHTEGAKDVQLRYAGEPKAKTPILGGTYREGALHFILSKSANPDQHTVKGRTKGPYGAVMEVRGTYYVKRNAFAAFGEMRGAEEAGTIKIDGKFEDGVFRLRYVFNLRGQTKPLADQMIDVPYEGKPELDWNGSPKDPKKPDPKPSRGSLEGNLSTDRASAKIGETIKLNLSYSLKGRDDDVIQESVALYGPSGAVLARSDKERSIVMGSPSKRGFDIKCDKEGTYKVSVRVKGELSAEWKQEVSFKIDPKKPKTELDKTAAGSYGLVDKKVGKAAPAEDNVGQGYRASGSVSEGSLQISMTPLPGNFSGFSTNFTWSSPPSELKPGQVLEFTCSGSCTRSQKDPPGLNLTGWFRFSGLEVLEQTHATLYPQQNEFSASATGKYKVKVPLAKGSEITIVQGYTGWAWGSGGNWNPCVYTYKWGAKPTEGGKTEPGEPKEDLAPGGTTMVLTTPDDKQQIRVKLDTESITLNAGEPSKIVDITISGFRTNTLDRVEVVFPQATDGWASLPGQIVVGGGSGSYDPANMNRPDHTDGYFFSARSTAPDSEQTIDIIVRQKDAGQVRLKLKVKVVGKSTTPPANDAWSGTWTETLNPMNPLVLKRSGNQVIGTFWKGRASLKGTLDGDTLTFTFEGFNGKSGKGVLKLENGRLKGHYYEDGDATKWDILDMKRG